ncbi:MAG TPA: alpha-L-arabinofuranosidase C-terminal domain-containing protein [Armatimonadota bacterium]|nr:alpha-L-arabinofuranosidase C-terminal domain-containing protein [Armatimonadota bacterium]
MSVRRWICLAAPLGGVLVNSGATAASPLLPLRNASFDAGTPTQDGALPGWQIAVYGAQPEVALDEPAPGLRGNSLRIAASDASDTAIYQDVAVQAGAWYQLTAWVRTERLKADTPIYGAVCACDGPAPFRSSPNRAGTTPWREETICFRAPASGLLRVALFLVGFGKGTGTVWFDGLRLERADVQQAAPRRIVVCAERLCAEPVDRRIYGNFVEFLDHHVQGMRAQMLDDVSFEGILPPAEHVFWQKDKDVEDHPWRATGDTDGAPVELVEDRAFNGTKCYRISVADRQRGAPGIRQSGVPVEQGKRYWVALYLRGEDVSGAVSVALGQDYGAFVVPYAEARITGIGHEWHRHQVILRPDTTDARAELVICLEGTGTVWVDQVTLMPEGHVDGWRPDVVEATRALKPHCLRFGGSAVIGYDWKIGIGDPDRRVPFRNEYWGRMEPNDVGLDEFLRFCELVDAEPLVCVSYNTGDPADAAAQVEYCNGPADSRWGALRAANGHPKPYGVRLWQVGNEQSGEEYEARVAEYIRAMRAADPTIEILSSFPSDGLMERAGELIDYLCPHHYTPSLRAIVADIESQRDRIARLGRGRRIRLAVTEWNHTAGDMGASRALLGTQYNALFCARVLHIYQRNADLVAIANRSNLTNSWWAGVIQTRGQGLFVTPAYHAMRLMSEHCGTEVLRVTDDAASPVTGPEFGALLDVAATREGDRLAITVVNDGADTVSTKLDLSAHLRGARPARMYTLSARGPYEVNDLARPDHIAPREEALRATSELRMEFPAWSLTLLVVDL